MRKLTLLLTMLILLSSFSQAELAVSLQDRLQANAASDSNLVQTPIQGGDTLVVREARVDCPRVSPIKCKDGRCVMTINDCIETYEESEGNPDRPLIVGVVYNSEINKEDIRNSLPPLPPRTSKTVESIAKETEEGPRARASKPKEIVVVGSKVKNVLREILTEDGKIIVGSDGEEIYTLHDSGDIFIAGKKINVEKKFSGDIILKGKKIKENFYDEDEETTADKDHNKWIEILSIYVETEEDLTAYAAAVILEDRNVEEIAFYYNKISFNHKQPAKLFGFIPVKYTMQTTADIDKLGRVKVQMPWWATVFTKNNAKEIAKEMEQELQTIGDDAQLSNTDLQNKLQRQQQTLQTMSNIAKMHYDTGMAIIRKIG